MTYARTIAAVAIATIALTLAPQVYEVAETEITDNGMTGHIALAAVETLDEVVADDIIDGVRVVSDNRDHIDLVEESVEKFDRAGWSLTNTEIRFDANACTNAVGFHAIEHGHHVVVLCNVTEWLLLHELGHVWADLYLGEGSRAAWLELRGLEVWGGNDADWEDRGTEHVAEIIAFGLYDDFKVPTQIGNNDWRTVTEAFEWLMGIEPLSRQRSKGATTDHETTARVQVVAPRTLVPTEAVEVTMDDVVAELNAPTEYQFPIACGYPRFHSSHGGYGYVDPRDWVHVGVDIYAYEGTPVVSPVHGTVIDAGWNDIAGWKVVVEDRFGVVHRMVHLAAPPAVTEGARVSAGQLVGEVGRSGNAEGGGPHLHYEIRVDGETIDPMPWLYATGDDRVEAAPRSFYTTEAPEWSDCATRA